MLNKTVFMVLGLVIGSAQGQSLMADPGVWNPLSSEKLILMPASYLDKYVEQDFQHSELAKNIETADEKIQSQLRLMQELRATIANAAGEQQFEQRHQLLISKSDYIDAVEEKQFLDRQALHKKSQVYQAVLDKILRSTQHKSDSIHASLLSNQHSARQRMQRSTAMVDEMLALNPDTEKSNYAQQYGDNVARIDELKIAIEKHAANASPVIEGEEVSREDFVRHLLANVEAERAILNQEQLMLGYMARLVALDAHALEQDVRLGSAQQAGARANRGSGLADASSMFIE